MDVLYNNEPLAVVALLLVRFLHLLAALFSGRRHCILLLLLLLLLLFFVVVVLDCYHFWSTKKDIITRKASSSLSFCPRLSTASLVE